ncbi:DUF503 domain-containing protein [soil metagenome]
MLAAVCLFDLRIPDVHSLKEKRHVVKTLTASLRGKFNVSVAEVDHPDLWQRATLAISSVAGEGYHLKRVVHEVERHVERFGRVEVIDSRTSFHAPDD